MKNIYIGLLFFCFILTFGCQLKTVIPNESYCQSFIDSPRPKWIVNPELSGYYVGVGVSEYQNKGEKYQRENSYQDAVNSLASSLITKVTTTSQSHVNSQDGNVNYISEIYSRFVSKITLNNIQLEEWWTDPSSCQIWSLVKLEKNRGEKIISNYFSNEERQYEIDMWNEIKYSKNIADFESYLALYSDGLYKEQAENKITIFTKTEDEEIFNCSGTDSEFGWNFKYQIILSKDKNAYDGVSGRQLTVEEINPAYLSLIDEYNSLKGLSLTPIKNIIKLKINRLSKEFSAYYLVPERKSISP